MKIAIVQFPGNNCESESLYAIRQAGMEAEEFLWNESYEKLKEFDGYFIVGGFSYEDRSRSGIISALDPVMKYIALEAEKGKPVLGICNGAQILVETGLVPGLKNNNVGMALAVNKRVKDGKVLGTGYYNTWVDITLTAPNNRCAFTKNIKENQILHVPIAHGEGRFIIPEKLLEEMKKNNLTLFRYCDETGNIKNEFPINPNGAMDNLAAVCNPAGNVMAMMPHPERTNNGQPIFTSMRDYIAEEKKIEIQTLHYEPEKEEIKEYKKDADAEELIVDLIITDNEAETVKNALEHLDINVDIKRSTHWEIVAEKNMNKEELIKKIIESGELFNSNKEKVESRESEVGSKNTVNILVRYRDDFVGESKKYSLEHRLEIKGMKHITKGVLWHITAKDGDIETALKKVLETRILCNQYSQVCYIYT